MCRLAILFISFIGILSLSTPFKVETVKLQDVNDNNQES